MPIVVDPDAAGTELIVLDPSEVATGRTELSLSEGNILVRYEGVDWGTSEIQAYMAELNRGETPVDFRVPNRKISIPLILQNRGGLTFDAAREELQQKVALFQHEGGWLKRVLTNGGVVFLDVVNASLRLGGHWFQAYKDTDHEVMLELECLPDFYGEEVEVAAVSETTDPELVFTIDDVAGDYPGRVRVEVTEDQGQDQRGLFGAFRCRHYSSESTAAVAYAATALEELDAATLGGGVITHANLGSSWTPVVGTDFLTHTGTYRVFARVNSDDGDAVRLRFVWDVGDLSLPVENLPWQLPGASNDYIADLGEIRLDRVPVGDHRWQGQIQAIGVDGGEHVAVKRLWFQNVDESAWRLRAPISVVDGLVDFSVRDEFNQAVSGGSDPLTGLAATVGGTWTVVTGSDADDLVVEDTGHTAQRVATSDVSPRMVSVGTTNYTAVVARTDLKTSPVGGRQGVFARADGAATNNALTAWVDHTTTDTDVQVSIGSTVIGQADLPVITASAWYTLQLYVDTRGLWSVWFAPQGTTFGDPLASGTHSDLVTGGARQTGRVGLYALNGSATPVTHNFRNFAAFVPVSDAVVFADQAAELRTDGLFRATSDGTGNGPISHRVGDLPRIPVAGLEGRTVELFLKASRGDLVTLPDAGTDDITVQVFYRPSWLFVPSV